MIRGFKKSEEVLGIGGNNYKIYSISKAEKSGLGNFSDVPISLRIVLENQLRNYDGKSVTEKDIKAFSDWANNGGKSTQEISFSPSRVLMQDFTGVPAVVDLAAMRDAMQDLGGDTQKINPITPVDLVIDHSVMIDEFGTKKAFGINVAKEYERNIERYRFLKWGQKAFNNFRVVPPGTGICHQVNLEYLSRVVWDEKTEEGLILYPDTVVGTDSHTTMVNGLAVLGWGVGGIEAEAAMLGQPISMLIPEVIGFEIKGTISEGVTATDLVLKIVKMLREKGVVGKFVEFYGKGLSELSLADRATIANMAPEYGATCGFFATDQQTIDYLARSGRDKELIERVEIYSKKNGLWRYSDYAPIFTDTLALNLKDIVPAISGPKRPQDFVALDEAKTSFIKVLRDSFKKSTTSMEPVAEADFKLSSGKIVIASITSCTNTSNPYVMIGAGLLAKKADELGLKPKPWVKTSLAPGSKVVTEYLENSGLQNHLDNIGFNLVGYGCTTCIGNSGPLNQNISDAIKKGELVAVSVLSGNRNFEGRISPDVKANYLASPPLVVAYSLLGDMSKDLKTDPLGETSEGKPIYLKDIWPSNKEIEELVQKTVTREAFLQKYENTFDGDENWKSIEVEKTNNYNWPAGSTYVQKPPYFENIKDEKKSIEDIKGARVLAVFGDMVTTDHISPAGSFKVEHPAGKYLAERQIDQKDFNSYGSRRGNHEVMMRGTFANIRIKNELLRGVEGGFTLGKTNDQKSIFDAAMEYKKDNIPLVIFAGKEYGAGSSRDWAAKGTSLLGVKAVIAETFERIHRSNLVGMGVIPFEFMGGNTREDFNLEGSEKINIVGLSTNLKPQSIMTLEVIYENGSVKSVPVKCRIDTEIEIDYVQQGGVLHYVLKSMAS